MTSDANVNIVPPLLLWTVPQCEVIPYLAFQKFVFAAPATAIWVSKVGDTAYNQDRTT